MKYEELDDKAKEKAREWYNSTAFCDSSDWQHVYQNAYDMGKLMGIDIDTRVVKLVRGETFNELDINFSGFCSQGDGACFSATLYTVGFDGAVARVTAEVPNSTDLIALATEAEAIHGLIAAHHMERALADADYQDDYPEVELGMRFNIKGKSHNGFSTRMDNSFDVSIEFERAVNAFVESFADWIYNQLENEYDHQTSDAAAAEGIISNGYDFDEDGTIA